MGRLVGRAHHHSDADVVADVPQVLQALHAVVKGHGRRVEALIVGFVRRLVAQEVPVCPGVKQALVAVPVPFPEGERDGAVGVGCSYF